MPSFDYTAIDRQGKSVQGQVQAATRDEAALSLTRTGLLVSKLDQSGGAPAQTRAPVQSQISQQAVRATPVASPPPMATQSPVVIRKQAQGRPIDRTPIRTKPGRDKDLYFIFAQLQSYSKAGLNPVETFQSVAKTTRRQDYADSLLAAARSAEEGGKMSDVLERYIDLYPPHVIGVLRAAEEGGFFPEAYELMTDQAHASHQFKRWFVWLAWVCVFSLGSLPLGAVFFGAMHQTFIHQVDKGESGGFWAILKQDAWRQFVWPWGPITFAIILAIWAFTKFIRSHKRDILRHKLVMFIPAIRKRAQNESVATFGWAMGMLSRIGMPPRTVWGLASATVPNLFIREQLEQTGTRMGEQTKLSEALQIAPYIPEEYAPVVATGELTGDIPGQLMRASQMETEEFRINDKVAKGRVGCWMLLAMVVASLMVYVLYSAMYMRPVAEDVLHWDEEK